MASLQDLKTWYLTRSSQRVDLVGDFAGKELFAIHGEAMLAHCFLEARVNYKEGFQLLHAVHAVEKFLAELKIRGCRFHIVWFSSLETLSIPLGVEEQDYVKFLLTRMVLIDHLNRSGQENLRLHRSFSFTSPEDIEFTLYLSSQPIQFFLCSEAHVNQAAGIEAENKTRLALELIKHLDSQGYSIALIDNIDISSAKIVTTVFNSTGNQASRLSREGSHTEASSAAQAGSEPVSTSNGEVAHQLLLKVDTWAVGHDCIPLTAREAILIAALSELAKKNPQERHMASFLVHVALLKHHTLGQRALQALPQTGEDSSDFLRALAKTCLGIFKRTTQNVSGETVPVTLRWDAFDLIDGALFFSTLDHMDEIFLSHEAVATVSRLSQKLDDLAGVDLSSGLRGVHIAQPSPPPSITSGDNVELENLSYQHLLSFSHVALDHFFEDVRAQKSSFPPQPVNSMIFQEATHWHNSKKTLSKKHKPTPIGNWALKQNQKFMATTKKYADSLTSGAPETIHLIGKTSATAEASSWKEDVRQKSMLTAAKKAKKGKASSGPARSSEKPKPAAVSNYEKLWANKKAELQKLPTLNQRLEAAEAFESGLGHQGGIVTHHMSLYICNLLVAIFEQQTSAASGVVSKEIVAMMWSRLVKLKGYNLPSELSLELEKLATSLQALTQNSKARGSYDGHTSIEHQLEVHGPDMERGFDSARDPRVVFKPDAWQREVLDAIDANKSLCVIAPTSAGKTFISFYAMKKIMQSSDDDVLVYVAPTKALVNQIAAEIHGRFKKNFKHPETRGIWAIHTRDYRVNNPTGCQILVTVPHILQIMLLSPPNAEKQNSWAHRIKRIIFDEVHCIGQSEDGVVWEQLLLLAPCPIIALSATVGNPEEFQTWLANSQRTKGYDLKLVIHNARYSDLRKYIYHARGYGAAQDFAGFQPHLGPPAHGLDGHGIRSFIYVHPIASICNRNRGSLDDISLEARDCWRLWKCMVKHQTPDFPIGEELSPPNALPSLIKKVDILRWEADLKACLLAWMSAVDSPFKDLRQDLLGEIRDLKEHGTRPLAEQAQIEKSVPGSVKYFQLLLDLREQQGLPAIFFNYDRSKCEKIMGYVVEQLKQHEQNWKNSSREWARTLSDFEKWKMSQNKHNKASAASKKIYLEEGMSKLDVAREEGQKETSTWQLFDPEAPLDQFSFANPKACSKSELSELIRSLRWANLNPIFIEALKRGIGVHHAGMNRKYRQVVEMLCRRGFLTVVIATGTLALGINVPCKTVVFLEDSVFLSALNYRQGSGRAGRRGFDLLGNVVFFNVPLQRTFDIISSRLPDLRGQFPVSTSLILRILLLCHQVQNNAYSVAAAQSLLSQNLLYLGGPVGELAVKHHLRFSIEYLRRQHLLSQEGVPLNFAGLISHLYFTQNAAFAFHSLLKGGYFHRLCADIWRRPSAILLELMLVLSHLFGRHPCTRYEDEEWLEQVRGSSSIVLLPSLPPEAHLILLQHNRETLSIFTSYVSTYVEQHLNGSPDTKLPFSEYSAGGDGKSQTSTAGTQIRSPFAALSGFTDSFESIHDLCTGVRAGVFLEESAVPYIGTYPEDTNGVPWNAYLYDFFKHGDPKTLATSNGIKPGDVWFKLKDFSLILATIVTSLQNFLDPKAGYVDMTDVQDVFDRTEQQYSEAAAAADDEDEQPAAENTQAMLRNVTNQTTPAKKAAVAESWDDEDDDEEGNDDGSENNAWDENDEDSHHGGGGEPGNFPGWHGRGRENLVNVLTAFRMLQREFDAKFKKMWA